MSWTEIIGYFFHSVIEGWCYCVLGVHFRKLLSRSADGFQPKWGQMHSYNSTRKLEHNGIQRSLEFITRSVKLNLLSFNVFPGNLLTFEFKFLCKMYSHFDDFGLTTQIKLWYNYKESLCNRFCSNSQRISVLLKKYFKQVIFFLDRLSNFFTQIYMKCFFSS